MSQQIWNKISIAHAILGENRAFGSGVCIYTYAGGIPSVSELSSSSDGTGGDLGRGGAPLGGDAPLPLRLQRVSGFFAVPFWQGRQPSIWFSKTIAGCLSMAAFTLLCPGNSSPASSLLGLRSEVSWLVVAFPLLRHVKTLLWPFWLYSRQDTCRTVQAVPDLLVLP